ncbi:MAG: protein kinase, partial [Deltaproteobacteria bacterium]|nr:protein kinase [Deltaproteobacteria bacterium]
GRTVADSAASPVRGAAGRTVADSAASPDRGAAGRTVADSAASPDRGAAGRTVADSAAAPDRGAAGRTVADFDAAGEEGAGARRGHALSSFGAVAFRGYPVERPLSTEGGEADIFVIRDGEGREYVLRLYREGRAPAPGVLERLVALSARRSPCVVNTYEAGLDEETGRFYEIQEYLPEGDLEAWARGRKVTGEEFRELASQLAEAVSLIHREGIIHRDIKPDNILLRSRSPLRVALADFGISSAADPGSAARETRTAATPLYSPPESFAGFAGPAGDWWSLGAVLLECAAGSHPLAGLPLNMVMREIGSRGLRVPEDLPAGESRLLKGLLTRDDRRRWGGGETAAWLAGSRDIPIHYEGDAAYSGSGAAGEFQRPFVFMGRPYRSPGELAGAFASGPAAWEAGAAALSRGLVRDWLEENRAYDEAVSMEDPEAGSPDAALFSFILHFRPDLGPVYRGRPLSLDSVLESFRDPDPSPERAALLDDLVSGRLKDLPAAAERRGGALPETLGALLAGPPEPERRSLGHAREPTAEWPPRGDPEGGGQGPAAGAAARDPKAGAAARELYVAAIAAARHPGAYVWGLAEGLPGEAEALRRVLSAGVPPVSWEWLEANIPAPYSVPQEVFDGLGGGPPGYRRAAEGLMVIADLISEAGDRPCFFYRKRTVAVRGHKVSVSPLSIGQYTRYFQFRLMTAAAGRRSGAAYHEARVIRDLEEAEGARSLNPFQGSWAWAGNWLPLAAAAAGLCWVFAIWKAGMTPATARGVYLIVLRLILYAMLGFWIIVFATGDRYFPRLMVIVVLGAAAVALSLLYGLTLEKGLAVNCYVAMLVSLVWYRMILGYLLKRRLLERGGVTYS